MSEPRRSRVVVFGAIVAGALVCGMAAMLASSARWVAPRTPEPVVLSAPGHAAPTPGPGATRTPRSELDAALRADEVVPNKGRLTIRVVAREGGATIAGARVVARIDEQDHEATTDATGVAKLVDLPADGADLTVSASGFVRASTQAVGEEEHVVELATGVVAEGRVLETDGRPIVGARVEAHPVEANEGFGSGATPLAAATSGPDGSFRLEDLPADSSSSVSAVSRFHIPSSVDWDPTEHPRIELRLAEGGEIRGIVRDPEGGLVDDAKVMATSEETAEDDRELHEAGWTDAEGRYAIEGVPLGRVWTVFAEKDGFANSIVASNVRIDAGRREAACDFVLRRAAQIELEVVDPSGEPVVFGDVKCSTEGGVLKGRVHTGGSETLTVAVPGWCILAVDAPGFPLQSTEFDLAEGVTRAVRIQLVRGAAVLGVAVDDLGRPVERAEIKISGGWPSAFFWERTAKSDSDGSFVVEGLDAGSRKLTAHADGHAWVLGQEVEVPSKGVRVVLARHGRVELQLSVPTGTEPPEVYWLSIADDGGSVAGSENWRDGAYSRSLSPGRHRATVKADGFAIASVDFEVRPGQTVTPPEIRLERGFPFGGRVVDANGAGVEGVTVWSGGTSAVTDAQGGFAVEHAVRDDSVRIGAEGWVSVGVSHDVRAGAPPLVVTLHRGAVLRGVLRSTTKSGIHGIHIEATREGGGADPVRIDSDYFGRYSERLLAGRWHLSVIRYDEGEPYPVVGTRDLELREGEDVQLDITVDK